MNSEIDTQKRGRKKKGVFDVTFLKINKKFKVKRVIFMNWC